MRIHLCCVVKHRNGPKHKHLKQMWDRQVRLHVLPLKLTANFSADYDRSPDFSPGSTSVSHLSRSDWQRRLIERFCFPPINPPCADSSSLTGVPLCADEAAEAWSVMWVVFGGKCRRRWHNMTHCSWRQIVNRRHYAHCLKNTHLNTQLSKHTAWTCSLCLWEREWGRINFCVCGWSWMEAMTNKATLISAVPVLVHRCSGRKGQNN